MASSPGERHPRPTQNSKLKTQNSPEALGEILSRLFVARGWGRRQDRLRLEQAWAETAGPEHARQTRVGGLRRGVLDVVVGNSVLLQELAHFHKRRLLEALRCRLAGTTITDLRFRAGVVIEESK
jgi:predicted nucleic acid-binding Zn ribbon protein